MSKHKIFTILSAFSKKEMRDFLVFLKSTYFNKSEKMIELFLYIRKFYPLFAHKKIAPKKVFKHLQPDKEFYPKYVNDRYSDLLKLVRLFLVTEQAIKNPEVNSSLLRDSYETHGLFEYFQNESMSEIKKLEESNLTNWEDLLKLWDLKETMYKHPMTHKFNPDLNNAIDIMPLLDESFAILKLRYGLEDLMRSNIFKKRGKKNDDLTLLKEVIESFKNSDNVAIVLYIKLIHLFTSDSSIKDWQECYELFEHKISELPFEEKNVFLSVLIHLKYRMSQKNKITFLKILNLYKIGLKSNLWVRYNRISNVVFKNIVVCGISAEEYDWTAIFINDHTTFLEGKEENIKIEYAKAYIAFHQEKNYKKVLDILKESISTQKNMDLNDKSDFRSLYVRSICELALDDSSWNKHLESSLNNFEQFIRGHYNVAKRLPYQNLIYFIKKLIEPTATKRMKQEMKEKLTVEFEKRSNILSSNWVKQKIDNL